MENKDPKNETIQKILIGLDELESLINNNLMHNDDLEIEEPVFNSERYEPADTETFENSEWDFGNRSICSMNTGYAGAELKAANLKIKGNIVERSFLYIKNNLFCGNCFGYVEARNMCAESAGTFYNKTYFKDRQNIRISGMLIIKGKSLFAHIDTWNAEFYGLIRNSNIYIGHIGIFHELGNGSNIFINPENSFFFTKANESIEELNEQMNQLEKERKILENEMNTMKYKYEKMSRFELDKMPYLTRVRIRENRKIYEDTIRRFDEIDIFVINKVFETKRNELISKLAELKKNALLNARIIVKGKIKPFVTISIEGKSRYITEDMENISIRWNGNEIVIEDLE